MYVLKSLAAHWLKISALTHTKFIERKGGRSRNQKELSERTEGPEAKIRMAPQTRHLQPLT